MHLPGKSSRTLPTQACPACCARGWGRRRLSSACHAAEHACAPHAWWIFSAKLRRKRRSVRYTTVAGRATPSSACAPYRPARQRGVAAPGARARHTPGGSASDSARHASWTGACSRKRTCARGAARGPLQGPQPGVRDPVQYTAASGTIPSKHFSLFAAPSQCRGLSLIACTRGAQPQTPAQPVECICHSAAPASPGRAAADEACTHGPGAGWHAPHHGDYVARQQRLRIAVAQRQRQAEPAAGRQVGQQAREGHQGVECAVQQAQRLCDRLAAPNQPAPGAAQPQTPSRELQRPGASSSRGLPDTSQPPTRTASTGSPRRREQRGGAERGVRQHRAGGMGGGTMRGRTSRAPATAARARCPAAPGRRRTRPARGMPGGAARGSPATGR